MVTNIMDQRTDTSSAPSDPKFDDSNHGTSNPSSPAPLESTGGTIKNLIKRRTIRNKDNYDKSFVEGLFQILDTSIVKVHSAGLENFPGDKSCSLNSFIQALWHLRSFQNKFLETRSLHHRVGDPCIICTLHDVLIELKKASEVQGRTVSSRSLRTAMANYYPNKNLFQQEQINDHVDLFGVVFDCMHESYTSPSDIKCTDLYCVSERCIPHRVFGLIIYEKFKCHCCELESGYSSTTYSLFVPAADLHNAKMINQYNPFDKLLEAVITDATHACDHDARGCGALRYVHHTLFRSPDVFIVVLGWNNGHASLDLISAALASISTEIDMSVIYHGVEQGNKHFLVSLIWYAGLHYCCFALEDDQWLYYSDKDVKVIGDWMNVLNMCEKCSWQPLVLFFEASKVARVDDQLPGRGEALKGQQAQPHKGEEKKVDKLQREELKQDNGFSRNQNKVINYFETKMMNMERKHKADIDYLKREINKLKRKQKKGLPQIKSLRKRICNAEKYGQMGSEFGCQEGEEPAKERPLPHSSLPDDTIDWAA